MIESSVKHRKRYVEYQKGKFKPTGLISGPGHSSDECKILVDFGSKYDKSRPAKDRRHNPANRNKFNSQQKINAINNCAVDEVLLHENQKLSA